MARFAVLAVSLMFMGCATGEEDTALASEKAKNPCYGVRVIEASGKCGGGSGGSSTCYRDNDEDGFGSTHEVSCGTGTPTNNTDCDDNDPAVKGPDFTYPDEDGDGYGDEAADPVVQCATNGFVDNNWDCADDPQCGGTLFNPGVPEGKQDCWDGDDTDCDLVTCPMDTNHGGC